MRFDFSHNFQYVVNEGGISIEKGILLNEIKLLELKLRLLKAMVASEGTKTKSYTSADLYGLLKDSEDITPEDINAVEVQSREQEKYARRRDYGVK